ncbi:MAG: Fe-only nitrogenase accessory AnfO family protein [Candidatus Metalachnospira sp.]|nr:Fe-only nitrogenase accessory AnfO family protein [Candidatus Metalachnospira sp.]
MGGIAVFTDENGNMANFYDCARFNMYSKTENGFKLQKTVEYEKIEPSSPLKIRRDTEALIELIENCDTVAFKEIFGIPFSVFEMAGFKIFSIDYYSDEMLMGIEEDIESLNDLKEKKEEMLNSAKPVETDTPGVYYFDLLEIQAKCPEISSKQALKQFLDSTPFMELRLVCAHIPPWIEKDTRFNIKSEKNDRGIYSVITLRQC